MLYILASSVSTAIINKIIDIYLDANPDKSLLKYFNRYPKAKTIEKKDNKKFKSSSLLEKIKADKENLKKIGIGIK